MNRRVSIIIHQCIRVSVFILILGIVTTGAYRGVMFNEQSLINAYHFHNVSAVVLTRKYVVVGNFPETFEPKSIFSLRGKIVLILSRL